jgi:2-polyprenyl-6-methoxyphenol hydroxylase-like FAD-dependent oxidoreductase
MVSFEGGVTVEADVVIAADGIHSVLQRHVVDPTEPMFSGMVAYRGLIPAAKLPDWPSDLVAWGGHGKHLMSYPVRAGELINYVGVVPADEQIGESWSAAADPASLAAQFADYNPQARRLVTAVDTTSVWGLYDREPLPRWTVGRLTLLGDAAHPMLPHMAQGTNQAIEDAMALATLLCGATAADVAQALTRYQTLRRDRTAQVQQCARTNGMRGGLGVGGKSRPSLGAQLRRRASSAGNLTTVYATREEHNDDVRIIGKDCVGNGRDQRDRSGRRACSCPAGSTGSGLRPRRTARERGGQGNQGNHSRRRRP